MDMDDMDMWCEFGAPGSKLDCIQDFSGFEADLEMLEVNGGVPEFSTNYSKEDDKTARQFIPELVYDKDKLSPHQCTEAYVNNEMSPKLHENNVTGNEIADVQSSYQPAELVNGPSNNECNIEDLQFSDDAFLEYLKHVVLYDIVMKCKTRNGRHKDFNIHASCFFNRDFFKEKDVEEDLLIGKTRLFQFTILRDICVDSVRVELTTKYPYIYLSDTKINEEGKTILPKTKKGTRILNLDINETKNFNYALVLDRKLLEKVKSHPQGIPSETSIKMTLLHNGKEIGYFTIGGLYAAQNHNYESRCKNAIEINSNPEFHTRKFDIIDCCIN